MCWLYRCPKEIWKKNHHNTHRNSHSSSFPDTLASLHTHTHTCTTHTCTHTHHIKTHTHTHSIMKICWPSSKQVEFVLGKVIALLSSCTACHQSHPPYGLSQCAALALPLAVYFPVSLPPWWAQGEIPETKGKTHPAKITRETENSHYHQTQDSPFTIHLCQCLPPVRRASLSSQYQLAPMSIQTHCLYEDIFATVVFANIEGR